MIDQLVKEKNIKTKKQTFWIFYLTIKYFCQGDTWKFAKEYAEGIVMGFK